MNENAKAELRLEIARKLAAKAFTTKEVEVKKVTTNGSYVPPTIEERRKRTLEVIDTPENDNLYTMSIERQFITKDNITSIKDELTKLMNLKTVTTRKLAKTLRDILKASLYACEVNIALSPDAGTSTLEFVTDGNYKRKIKRGESACFECIDQKDVVLQINSGKESVPKTKNAPNMPKLIEGETVVYVPLIGRAGGLGIIEIHGLISQSLSNMANYERSTDVLRAMIDAKDYNFVNYTRLWRTPTSRSGGIISDLDKKDYNTSAFPIVQGRIESVVHENNGVQFFGGSRYNLIWEDGLHEKHVTGVDLLNVYKNTPQSLGCTSVITEELLQLLLSQANEAAILLEQQKRIETLQKTKHLLNIPNLKDEDIADRALNAILQTVLNVKEALLLGIDLEGHEKHAIHGIIHILARKLPLSKANNRQLNKTPQQVLNLFISLDKQSNITRSNSYISKSMSEDASFTSDFKIETRPNSRDGAISPNASRPASRGIRSPSVQQRSPSTRKELSPSNSIGKGYETLDRMDPVDVQVKHEVSSDIANHAFADIRPKSPNEDLISRAMSTDTTSSKRTRISSSNGIRYLVTEDDKNASGNTMEWVCIELVLPSIFHWKSQPACTSFFVIVLKARNLNRDSATNDMKCMEEVSKMLAEALKVACEKNFRKNMRKDWMTEVEHSVVSWRDLPTVPLICDKIIQVAMKSAPGTNVYTGLMLCDGSKIIFNAASPHSLMKGKELLPHEGISFSVIETQGDTDKRKLISVGTPVNVKYGKVFFLAKITKNRGHGYYDVVYATKEKEVAVYIDRIYPLVTSFKMKAFGQFNFPVFCIPIKHKNKAFGVLVLDTFDMVQKAPYDPMPEPGLKVFLEHLGKVLGSTIDIHQKRKSLKRASKISGNINSTHDDLFDALFDVIFHNFLYISNVLIAKIVQPDVSTISTIPSATPALEMTATTKKKPNIIERSSSSILNNIKSLNSKAVINTPVQQTPDASVDDGSNKVHIIATRGKINKDTIPTLATFDPKRSSLKSVQMKGEKVAWLLCRIKLAKQKNKSGNSNENEKGNAKKEKPPSRENTKKHSATNIVDYIIVIESKSVLPEVDIEYLHHIQKFACVILQNIENKKQKALIRSESLDAIANICDDWMSYLNRRDEFFNEICDNINNCYLSANVYFGKLHLHSSSIEYILASPFSKMKGKKLLRASNTGISFSALDNFTNITVINTDTELIKKMHFFGSRESLEYPFVVIPVITHLDSVIGVLAADSCEDISQEDGRTDDVTSFMTTVSVHLGNAMKGFVLSDIRNLLKDTENNAHSFNSGIRVVKEQILELLPYASRVAEVKYESELFPIFRDNTLLSGKVFETSVTHICLIHFISAICFMHELQYPIIVVQYNNTIIKSFSCTEEDIKRLKPIQIIIPQGVLYNNIDIKIILRGKIHNIDRDVSKLSLKYNFLVNSGAKLYTFTLENENRGLPDVHSGQVKFVQRLYNSDDDVRIFIRKINCMNITVPHGKSSSSVTIDPFCVIIWKGNEIGRTEPVKNSMNPKWKDLNIAIKPSPTDDSRKGYLKIEVWNVDDIGMSTCLGYTLMSSDELKSTGTKWRPLRQNLSSEIDSTGNVIKTYDEEKMLGAINIHTEFMTAATLSESIQLEELNIPFLSNVIKDKNSSSSGGTKETHLDVADSTSKKRDVVINILKVRDLVLNPSQTTEIPPVDHFDTELRDYKPFCVIFFNNAEVYRTSSANIILHSNSNSSVTKQSHYSLRRSYFFEFVDESCQITIPLEMELENCSLRLEIWVIDEFGKNIQLGSSTIGDKQFASLVSCNFVKNRWLDIIDPCYSSDVNIDNNNIIFSHGEILISGMPRSVSSTMYGESTNIAQINSYDLSVVDIDLSHLFDNEITMESAIMQVRWNNMLCVNTKLPNKSVFDPPVENVDESFTNREYYNNNLKAVINKPQLLPFEFCKLRIDILTPDSMAENGDSQETVLVGVLSGQDLLYAIGQEYCRSVWVDIIRESKNDNDKIYGVGSCAFRVKVRLGPVGAVDMIEFDGREVAVDILAVSKLRNVNIGNKRVNAYCKAYYNDEIVGQTTICYAAFDAVWNWHRFVVKPPLVENVNDSLSLCSFRVEVWTAGTDSTASEKASSINDQKKSLFLGCVEVEGDDFVNVVHPKKPKSKWFPIKGLSNSILDIDQSYVCNNGAVKLRFGLKKKLMPGQSVSTGQIKGEEYFIKIHKANNLSEIDIFTKTNAVVIIYWNETEIGRTSVGKNTVNPEWTNESFLLIVPVKDSLEYQKLQLHVYDTTFGSTGEFLGAVEFLNAESLIKFLRDDNNITKEFPLTETKDLPSDANHLVKGSLFISASTVHVPPFEYPIQLYKNAILQIKSAENILMTNIIEECSDVLCILYWSSVYDNSVNVEIGRTTMIQKSRNPVWRNEYFLVKVPDNDEWTGIELKIVLYDLVSDLDRLCVGSVVIKGNDLKSILERYHPFCLDTVTYALDKMPPMNSDNKPNTGAVVQDGIAFVPQTISGRLLIAGGRLEDMKQYCPALVNDSTDNKDNILEHHESFHDGNSLHDFSSEMKENKSISVKDLTLQEKKSGVVSPSKKEKDVGQKVIIKIHKLLHITLPFFFVDNNTNLDSINPYFIITFDTTTIKNDKVKPIKVNSGINCYDYLYENDSVLSLSFYLPKSNDPSECNLQIEAYLPSPKDDGNAVTSIADMKSISNSVSTDTYVSINTDVFLGMVELSGVELVRLLRPRAGEKILSLRARGSTTVGSSRPGTSSSRPNTSGSDYAKGATIVISGNVPDLSRSLSSKKKSSKKEKEQMSTKKTNWRSLSSNLNMEEEVTNPLLLKKLYELHICEAKHLSSVSSLLSTYGDIYVDVFWRDEKIGSTHEMTAEAPQILLENPSDEKSNTETEKDFVDCVWENELFVLEKPEGELLVECELRLEVYEKRKFSQSPAFLGQVLMSGDAFQVWVDTATQEPTWLKLKHSDTIPEAEQKRVQGSLFLGIRDKEKTHDAGNPEVDMSLPLPPGYRDVEINILTAFNLGKVDTFSGTSDPFCVVKWDMREIGTSAVVKKTTSPIWEDACYKLRIPTHLHVDHSQKPDSNIFGVLGSKNDESIEPGISVKKKRAAVNIQPMSKEDVKVIEHNLTIEIWDKSTNSGNVFLGCHEFKGNELSLLFDMKTYGNRKLYKLNRTKRLAKKNQKYVKGNSTVEVLINPIKVFDAHSIKYELEVEIAAASGLTKTDRFSNTMNLFCILRWNHKIFGKTSSVIQGTEPKWKNEISQLVHQGEITDACLLYIELWNNDNAIGQGKFLGSVELKGDVILDLINSNNSEFQWYEIAKSNYLNSSLQKYVKGGKMSIRISDGTRNANAKNDFIIFEISILEATNLMKPLLGHIDSFCVIKLNGREIGQTVVAPKTENPKWIGERYTIKMKDNPNIVNEITLEMWSSEILGRGEFLGCVVIDMKELLYISNDDNFLSKKNKNILTRGWYSMQKTIGLPEIKQKNVQGNIHINCKVISHDSYLNNSPSAEVSLQWPVPPSPIPGSQIGLPIVNIKVLSCSNLIVPPSSSWVKLSSSTCDPFCIIYCNGLEVGMTNVCPNTTNPVWRGSEPISLKLPENVDKQEFWINIEVYNMQGLERGEFLGLVTFNFWSLFCLQNGKFTLPLRTQSDEPEQFIIGTITFTLDIQNSFWDTVKSINGPSIERKIQILGANNLPNVNNNLPSTKCIIIVDGIVKYRSVLESSTNTPHWLPIPEYEMLLDYRIPSKVVIQLFFVDVKEKKEVCMGEVIIPPEFILRPPTSVLNLWLCVPSRATAHVGYDFITDGSINILITNPLKNEESSAIWIPYSSRFFTPQSALSVKDINTEWNEKSYLNEGDILRSDELYWLGTNINFTSPNEIAARPEWLLLPLKDMGIIMDGTQYGTLLSQKYALAIQRPLNKLFSSDSTMLNEIYSDIQKSVIKLRRHEIYTNLRNLSLIKLRLFFENLLKTNTFKLSVFMKRISRVVLTCFPGSIFFMSQISKDYRSMRYSLFEKSHENELLNPLFFILWENQGCDWNSIGRHAISGSFENTSDFKSEYMKKYRLMTFSPFRQYRFPRIVYPLRSGDISSGVIGIENFDIYRGGLSEDVSDIGQVKEWFSQLGEICGDALYIGKERKALKAMEMYVLLASSSFTGLLSVLLENSLSVLQGCKLMEVWSINNKNRIKSLATSWPESISPPGRWVMLRDIKITFIKKAEDHKKNDLTLSRISNFLLRKPQEKVGDVAAVATRHNDDKNKLVSNDSEVCVGFVLGVYYGGFEECQYVDYIPNKKGVISDEYPILNHTFSSMKLYMNNDRDIIINIYYVNSQCAVLQQYIGKLQIITFKEKILNCNLYYNNIVRDVEYYSVQCNVTWPSGKNAAQRAVELKELAKVKEFVINIVSAFSLMKADLVGSSDPFCEIYWKGDLIGKTAVKKDNLDPVWNETFTVPIGSHIDSKDVYDLSIEIYDMNFLGKGSFLGKTSLGLEQLLFPPSDSIKIPLEPKENTTKSNLKTVGGYITLQHSVVYKEAEDIIEVMTTSNSKNNNISATMQSKLIEKLIFMENPVLKLLIAKADGLAKSDTIGASDPYVKIYRVDPKAVNKEANKKSNKSIIEEDDPIAITRVINQTLSPVWNEEHIFNLNIPITTVSKTSKNAFKEDVPVTYGLDSLSAWPAFCLEVWDKDNVGLGKFLGGVVLTPQIYCFKHNCGLELSTLPKYPKKDDFIKYVKGSIYLKFQIQENVDNKIINKNLMLNSYAYMSYSTVVELFVLSGNGLSKKSNNALMQKTVNSYCKILWGKDKIGETACKYNTLYPTWANERFAINITDAINSSLSVELVIEVWNKKSKSETVTNSKDEFIGEICIPIIELMHPVSNDTITKNLITKAQGNKPSRTLSSSISFRLITKHLPLHYRCKPKDIQIAEIKEEIISSKHKADPIETYYNIEKVRVVTSSPIDLSIIPDVEAEEQRQKYEKLKLDKIINKLQQEENDYVQTAFDQHGVISELHYGQTLYAVERNENTVLHISNSADVYIMPAIVKDPEEVYSISDSDTFAHIESKQHEQKDQQKSVEANDTSKTTQKGKSLVKSKSVSLYDDDIDIKDIVEDVAVVEEKPKRVNWKLKPVEVVEKREKLCLVSRYDQGKIPKRDTQFLLRLRDIISNSILLFEARQNRKIERRGIVHHFQQIYDNISRHHLEDIIMSAISHMEKIYDCSVDIYILQPKIVNNFGPTGYGRRKFNEKIFFSKSQIPLDELVMPQTVLMRCAHDSGMCINEPLASTSLQQFIDLASKICRHGLMLQFYRGNCSVIGCDWRRGFSEASINQFEDIKNTISVFESEETLNELQQLSRTEAAYGACVMPLMSIGDVFSGIMVLKGTDKIPQSLYRIKSQPVDTTGNNDVKKNKKTNNDDEEEDDDANVKEVEWFEEGTSETFRDISQCLGKCILSVNMSKAIRDVKTYPINEFTTELDIIRYTFRKLIEAVPAICEIAIWKIKVPQLSEITIDGKIITTVNANKGDSSLFSKIGLASLFSNFGKKSKVDNGDEGMLDISMDMSSGHGVSPYYQTDKASMNQIPVIQAGYFRSESAHPILSSPDERLIINGLMSKTQQNASVLEEGLNIPTILENDVQTLDETNNETESVITEQMSRNGITCYDEIPWKVDVPVSLANIINSGLKTFENDKDSESERSEVRSEVGDSDKNDEDDHESDDGFDAKSIKSLKSKNKSSIISVQKRPSFLSKMGQSMRSGVSFMSTKTEVVEKRPNEINPIVMAQCEIYRCLRMLNKTSFHINSGAGQYLSFFNLDSKKYLDKILKKLFISSIDNNNNNDVMDDISDIEEDEDEKNITKDGQNDAKESKDDGIDRTDKNANNDGTAESKDAKKGPMRNSLFAKSKKDTLRNKPLPPKDTMAPRSQSGIQPPNQNPPPLPPGPKPPKPSTVAVSDSSEEAKDSAPAKRMTSREAKEAKAAKLLAEAEKKLKESKRDPPEFEYAFAVRTYGIGGLHGWGVIGEDTAHGIDEMAATMCGVLLRLAEKRRKDKREQKVKK